MIGGLVLAIRASPDWGGLARDHAAGQTIDRARFMPAKHKTFPLDIPDHIARWNRLSKVSFFACRERIRDIAAANLATVTGATIVRADDVAAAARPGTLTYFLDDDDWFHPDTAAILRDRAAVPAAPGAVVTPFFRLARNLVTFTRDGRAVPGALGRCEPYRYRYCTNNYGLTAAAIATGADDLVEHVDASPAADERGFVDSDLDIVLSATNKTPCSAGWVRELPDGEAAFRAHVEGYVAALAEICATSPHEWVNAPLRATHDLFREVLD